MKGGFTLHYSIVLLVLHYDSLLVKDEEYSYYDGGRTEFCHAKIGPAQKWSPGPILAARDGSPGPPKNGRPSVANSGPSRTKFGLPRTVLLP